MNMQKRRFGRPWLTIIVTAAILTIAWLANSAIAQEAPPGAVEQAPSEATLDAVVAKRITYQGVLHEGGVPVTGNRNMTFNFFTNNACSGVAVYVTTVPNVPVTEGLFDVAPEINPNIFFGGGIWLEVEVAGAPLGCEPVYPAPYAFSLRPGAHIVGESTGSTFGTAVVNIESTAASWLNYHALFVRTATGHAVHAESDGIGVYGYSSTTHAIRGEANTGTAGYFTSNDGHGIYASTNSNKHYNFAGYFDANGGYGIYTHSELNQGIRAFAG
ncbi:MAG: hypothetical protein JXB35_17220, partial [Anaerolineae bacterium]|nr:hypothetical protein [Anaerolineae bacterium]